MDLRQLENIVAIAEERSISRAAERLFISQPALSQQVSKLEARLGVPLFSRDKQGLSLTQAGKVYVENAKKYSPFGMRLIIEFMILPLTARVPSQSESLLAAAP